MSPSRENDESPHCLICDSRDHLIIHRLNGWNMLKCRNCTLVYVDPLPSAEQLSTAAEDAHSGASAVEVKTYHRIRRLDNANDPVIKSCNDTLMMIELATTGRTLLDIGCGEGTFAAVANKRGWKVQALDTSITATKIARDTYYLNTINCTFPCNNLLDGQKFDAIVMLDILEHIPNPVEAVAAAGKLLREGGVLYVNSPNHRSLLCWTIDLLGKLRIPAIQALLNSYYNPAHVTVFNPNSLSQLMIKCNLHPLSSGKNSPILDRLNLSLILRLCVQILIQISKFFRVESRVWILARL